MCILCAIQSTNCARANFKQNLVITKTKPSQGLGALEPLLKIFSLRPCTGMQSKPDKVETCSHDHPFDLEIKTMPILVAFKEIIG